MKTLQGHYGECRFQDCLDGMKELSNQSFDLRLTDSPYNENFDAKRKISIEINYKDNLSEIEYQNLIENCWKNIKRITNKTILTCGYKNLKTWLNMDDFDYLIWYNRKGNSCNRFAQLRCFEPILCYSEMPLQNKSMFGVYDIPNTIHDQRKLKGIKHPCPKNIKFWFQLVLNYKPISIIDPFLGSGTTAQVCETLGIKWLGFELKEEYIVDIEKRIKLGIQAHDSYKKQKKKQLTLG